MKTFQLGEKLEKTTGEKYENCARNEGKTKQETKLFTHV